MPLGERKCVCGQNPYYVQQPPYPSKTGELGQILERVIQERDRLLEQVQAMKNEKLADATDSDILEFVYSAVSDIRLHLGISGRIEPMRIDGIPVKLSVDKC